MVKVMEINPNEECFKNFCTLEGMVEGKAEEEID